MLAIAAKVFAERDVQAPVQLVLNFPMVADQTSMIASLRRKAANEERDPLSFDRLIVF